MKLQPGMIEAAIASGITHFYPFEYGSDLSKPGFKNLRYYRDKYALLMTGPFTRFAASEFFGVDMETYVVEAYERGDAILSVTGQEG
jgi:hypothetical protein